MQTMTEEQREKLQQPEKPKPIFETSHCVVNPGKEYALNIGFDDLHVDFDTFGWKHKPGYHAKIAIFELMPQDMKDLASAIMAEAIKIELEQAK